MFYLCKTMEKMIQFTQGCTEPAAIALNAAYTGKYLQNAEKLSLEIDKMTFKNAYRAGIPNSKDNIGVTFALLYGYLIANTENELEIFDKLNDEIIHKARQLYDIVEINVVDKNDMFIKTTAYKGSDKAVAVTEHSHTNIVCVSLNNDIKINKEISKEQSVCFEKEFYDVDKWPEYVDRMYQDSSLRQKMEEAIKTNILASEKSLYDEDSVFSSVYARMKGDRIRVASCAGSGNKGLTAMIAPLEYAQANNAEKEKTTKAVLLSCFVTSLITSRLGFISSVCGAIHAAGVGVLAAILYIDDNLSLFEKAFNNYIVTNGGVICDGAKRSCAIKAANAVESAYLSIEFAKRGAVVDYKDGMLGDTFYKTIKNLEKYKEAFGMFDMRTIEILREKNGHK